MWASKVSVALPALHWLQTNAKISYKYFSPLYPPFSPSPHIFTRQNNNHTSSRSRQDEAQTQFDEFVEESKELEAELESQLEQAEKKISDLSKIKQSMELENDKLKVHVHLYIICLWITQTRFIFSFL